MNPLTNVANLNKINEKELSLGVAGSGTSWHSKYKDSAWIFIGGLPFDLTEGDILCVFSQYGEIVNINLVRDQKTGKTKGFCFICYEDQRSTILAVDNLNGFKLLGRVLRVDHVENYRQPKETGEEDDTMKNLREVGCAPTLAKTESEAEEEDDFLLDEKESRKKKKVKKEKKKKVKKEKKRKKFQSSSDSETEDDKSTSREQDIRTGVKIKREWLSPEPSSGRSENSGHYRRNRDSYSSVKVKRELEVDGRSDRSNKGQSGREQDEEYIRPRERIDRDSGVKYKGSSRGNRKHERDSEGRELYSEDRKGYYKGGRDSEGTKVYKGDRVRQGNLGHGDRDRIQKREESEDKDRSRKRQGSSEDSERDRSMGSAWEAEGYRGREEARGEEARYRSEEKRIRDRYYRDGSNSGGERDSKRYKKRQGSQDNERSRPNEGDDSEEGFRKTRSEEGRHRSGEKIRGGYNYNNRQGQSPDSDTDRSETVRDRRKGSDEKEKGRSRQKIKVEDPEEGYRSEDRRYNRQGSPDREDISRVKDRYRGDQIKREEFGREEQSSYTRKEHSGNNRRLVKGTDGNNSSSYSSSRHRREKRSQSRSRSRDRYSRR